MTIDEKIESAKLKKYDWKDFIPLYGLVNYMVRIGHERKTLMSRDKSFENYDWMVGTYQSAASIGTAVGTIFGALHLIDYFIR